MSFDEVAQRMLHGLAAVVGLVSRPAPSVAVVGTGWSGLYAIKYLREEGLNVVAFERERTSGGIWGLAEAQHVSASSSKTYLHASDYSFDSDDDFPTAAEVQEHLRGYAAHHGLAESIQYGTRVDHAAFDSAKRKWRLSVSTAAGSGSEALEVDKLVLTQGLCGTPMVPTDLAAQFAAAGVPHMHMADFRKDALPEWAQRGAKHACLVIGGGESATDIAASLADRSQSARVVLSLRTGRWFLPKMKPPLGAIPADLASRRTFINVHADELPAVSAPLRLIPSAAPRRRRPRLHTMGTLAARQLVELLPQQTIRRRGRARAPRAHHPRWRCECRDPPP